MIEQVKNYIKAHYAEDMSIKELADVACVSQNYFSALFKKQTLPFCMHFSVALHR